MSSMLLRTAPQSRFSRAELTAAFERVRDPRDRRGPILALIPTAERRAVTAAVVWFTATIPVFRPVPGRPDRLVVSASGYRPESVRGD